MKTLSIDKNLFEVNNLITFGYYNLWILSQFIFETLQINFIILCDLAEMFCAKLNKRRFFPPS